MGHLNFQIWYQICDLGPGSALACTARSVAHVDTGAKKSHSFEMQLKTAITLQICNQHLNSCSVGQP